MNETALKAMERTGSIHLIRKAGFIPGVLYGEGYEKGAPVKFEATRFYKLVHNKNAKVWVDYNGKRHFGMIKELQKDMISGKILHTDIRILSRAVNIRIKLPIVFTGVVELEHSNLSLKIMNSTIDVSGEAGLLPEHVTLNVENFKAGDMIKSKDLPIDNSITVHDPSNEVYAAIIENRNSGDAVS
jgi:large subunit ribosomal protein L25